MTGSDKGGISRRYLLASAGAGAGLAGLGGLRLAHAAILPDPETTETRDVIVVGSGMAGCAAALEAAGAGAAVAVLEKAEDRWMGGNSLLAGGGFSLPVTDDAAGRADFLEDYIAVGKGRGNETIYQLMADNVVADLDWLRGHGVAFEEPGPWPPYRTQMVVASPGFFAGMPRLFRQMRTRLGEMGADIVFDTKARELLLDNSGAVAGVRALGPDGVVDYRGRVVLATGGYAGNTRMLEAYSDPNAGAMMVRGIPHATGDGHVMALRAGAGLGGMGGVMALHIAAVDPVETAAGQPAAVVPHAISINNAGERFVDESRGYVAHGKAVLTQPGQMTTLIFDQPLRERIAGGVMDTFARLGLTVHEAPTLRALAEATGLPPAQTEATVEAFNAAVADGAAPEASPPKAKLANRIETPPFYAFSPLVPGITLTFGGIMIDGNARVQEADGRVITGLFAAGEGAGAPFFDDYIGGGALSNCLVMGRIAGRGAAT